MAAQHLLALDTSTLVASVGLTTLTGGRARASAQAESDVKNHSDQLLTMIDGVLGEGGLGADDLAGVAVGAGPGSFTGLRIGISTAKGLCFATGSPLWLVSSLAALARDASLRGEADIVAPVLDARRGEVFFGVYDVREDAPRAIAQEAVAGPAEAAARIAEAAGQNLNLRGPALAGDGALLYAEAFEERDLRVERACRQTPSAASVGALAAAHPPVAELARAAPTYLRPSEAERKYPQGNPGGAFSRAP